MRKFFLRSTCFFALLIVLYLSAVFVLSGTVLGQQPIIRQLFFDRRQTLAGGCNLERFTDAEKAGNVDILFLGSSHAATGFDPAIFEKEGIEIFDLGSSSQTPLNTYYLLRHYYPIMKPKLLVCDLFPLMLSTDGLESFWDLLFSVPLFKELVPMALSTGSPYAVNSLVAEYFTRWRQPDISHREYRNIRTTLYISKGFNRDLKNRWKQYRCVEGPIKLANRQMAYLKKILEYARSRKVPVIFVTQPLSKEYVDCTTNYAEVSAELQRFAAAEGVPYYDFNRMIRMGSRNFFEDADHLNQNGVEIYNKMLIDLLRAKHGDLAALS